MPVGLGQLSVPALGKVMATRPPNSSADLPCGQGPSVRLDGRVLPTKMLGERFGSREPDADGARGLRRPDRCRQGRPRPSGRTPRRSLQGDLAPSDPGHELARSGWPVRTHHRVPGRPPTRSVQVGAGAAAYLAVAQNYNAGWKATLDGRSLRPARLDGWEQAWVAPGRPWWNRRDDNAGRHLVPRGPAARSRAARPAGCIRSGQGWPTRLCTGPVSGARHRLRCSARSASSCSCSSAAPSPWCCCRCSTSDDDGDGRRSRSLLRGGFVAAGIAVAISPGAQPGSGFRRIRLAGTGGCGDRARSRPCRPGCS